MEDAVADDGFIDEDEDGEIDGEGLLAEHGFESSCLANGAGVAIEDPRAVVCGEPLADDLDGDFIGDEEAALEVLGGAQTGGGACGFLLAEHGADAGGLEGESLRDEFRLGAFAGSGRPEQDEATMHGAGRLPTGGGWR